MALDALDCLPVTEQPEGPAHAPPSGRHPDATIVSVEALGRNPDTPQRSAGERGDGSEFVGNRAVSMPTTGPGQRDRAEFRFDSERAQVFPPPRELRRQIPPSQSARAFDK